MSHGRAVVCIVFYTCVLCSQQNFTASATQRASGERSRRTPQTCLKVRPSLSRRTPQTCLKVRLSLSRRTPQTCLKVRPSLSRRTPQTCLKVRPSVSRPTPQTCLKVRPSLSRPTPQTCLKVRPSLSPSGISLIDGFFQKVHSTHALSKCSVPYYRNILLAVRLRVRGSISCRYPSTSPCQWPIPP